jgi:acetylornithine deacetylase/succinyl-diaminopimelate desuccinylase family protein
MAKQTLNALEQCLAELINIPSPNPPGDCRAIAAYVRDYLAPTGADIKVIHPEQKPDADSVIATLGDGSAPVIMLHAHIDTVPVASDEAAKWTSDPFSASVRDGKMYGKGSIDDKAPLAAMMRVFVDSAERPINGTLVLVAAAEEEVGGQLGTRWLADNGHLPACDFIVVGEQTDNHLALAHKGVMRATVTTTGRSVHATNPARGINAITAMAKVVLALADYHDTLQTRQHPLVGTPTCNVGVIQGGSTANAVPDFCELKLDRRMIPREDPATVQQEMRDVIASLDVQPAEVTIDDFLFSSWFDASLSSDLAKHLQAALHDAGVDPEPIGYLPGSDAKHLMTLARGDMVIFGPGSYEVAHAFDEYTDLADLQGCETILRRWLERCL